MHPAKTMYDIGRQHMIYPINGRIKSVQPQRFSWLIDLSVFVPWDDDPCWYVSVALNRQTVIVWCPIKRWSPGPVNLRFLGRPDPTKRRKWIWDDWMVYDMDWYGYFTKRTSCEIWVCRGCFAYVWTDGVADCQCRWGASEEQTLVELRAYGLHDWHFRFELHKSHRMGRLLSLARFSDALEKIVLAFGFIALPTKAGGILMHSLSCTWNNSLSKKYFKTS